MDKSTQAKLDEEKTEKIDVLSAKLNAEQEIDIKDIFSDPKIVSSLEDDKVLLSCYDRERLMMSLPFHKHIYVSVCIGCSCVYDVDSIKPFLESGCVIPVLRNPYSYYKTDFIRAITKYSHISSTRGRKFMTIF